MDPMIRLQKLLLILCVLFFNVSQAAEKSPFNSVQNLFAAMSAFDDSKMKAVITEDFQLLEAGEVWNIDMLIQAIKPNGNIYKRRNYFSLINVVSKKDVVWISYWNQATFSMQNKSREISWLESAVLVKEKDNWKIQLLHSTKVSSKNIPTDVEFIEYVK